MKNCFYCLLALFGFMLVELSSCGKSAEEKAAIKAHEDSVRIADSTRVADSIFAAQTQDMLAADTFMANRLDSLRRVQVLARTQAQQAKVRFVKEVMARYIATLNEGGNVSTALGSDASNQVVSALAAVNGGPSTAMQDTTGRQATYALLGVSTAGEPDWVVCAWKKGTKRVIKHMKVVLNVRKFRIEELR